MITSKVPRNEVEVGEGTRCKRQRGWPLHSATLAHGGSRTRTESRPIGTCSYPCHMSLFPGLREAWGPRDGGGVAGYRLFNREIQVLEPLDRVNIAVGPNDSGKSNFLSSLFSRHAPSLRMCLPLERRWSLWIHSGTRTSWVRRLLHPSNSCVPSRRRARQPATRRRSQSRLLHSWDSLAMVCLSIRWCEFPFRTRPRLDRRSGERDDAALCRRAWGSTKTASDLRFCALRGVRGHIADTVTVGATGFHALHDVDAVEWRRQPRDRAESMNTVVPNTASVTGVIAAVGAAPVARVGDTTADPWPSVG